MPQKLQASRKETKWEKQQQTPQKGWTRKKENKKIIKNENK